MYVWTAIDVDSQLKEIKDLGLLVSSNLGVESPNFTLPLHISLKISFKVNDDIYAQVIDRLCEYFKRSSPATIDIDGIEQENDVVWMRIKESPYLSRLHNDLDRLLLDEYGILQHPYDLDFKFHVTLFMHQNSALTQKTYGKLKNIPLPSSLTADQFIIGTSPSGLPGTYSVIKRVALK